LSCRAENWKLSLQHRAKGLMLIAFIGVSETYLCCKVIPVPQAANSVTHAFFIVFYLNYIAKSVSFVLLPENWKFSKLQHRKG
jgi:hypothetical protein